MKKTMTMFLSALLSGLLVPGAYAAAPGANASVKDRDVSKGSAGVPMTPEVRGHKVFEVLNSASATLVLDEAGSAPANGTLHKVCVGTGAATEFSVVFDSATTSGLALGTSGKRLAPPLHRDTDFERCLTLDAQFHYGLVILNSTSAGDTHLYWDRNGGRH